jgi:3-hydroxypropanoate dehydrogenase
MTPLRVLFVKSAAAKEKLRPALSPGNVDKTMAAPATAIIAHDLAFYEHADTLLPGREFKPKLLAMTPEKRLEIAKQSSTLQAGYLIIAARALGLDAGPMGGFDPAKVDEAFFAGTAWRSSLLVNLGYGDASKLRPRNPRLAFEDVGRIE